MGAVGFLVGLVLLGFNLFGTLRLERMMRSNYDLELAFIVIAGIMSMIALLGILLEKRWGWSLFVLIGTANLFNLGVLLWATSGSVTMLAAMLANVLAIMLGLLALDADTPVATLPLETYTPPENMPAVEPVYDTLPSFEAPMLMKRTRSKPKKRRSKKK